MIRLRATMIAVLLEEIAKIIYGNFIEYQRRFLATKISICLMIHERLKQDTGNKTDIVNSIPLSN